jgi:hypothetical protein
MRQILSSVNVSFFSMSELKCSANGAPSISSITMYSFSSAMQQHNRHNSQTKSHLAKLTACLEYTFCCHKQLKLPSICSSTTNYQNLLSVNRCNKIGDIRSMKALWYLTMLGCWSCLRIMVSSCIASPTLCWRSFELRPHDIFSVLICINIILNSSYERF